MSPFASSKVETLPQVISRHVKLQIGRSTLYDPLKNEGALITRSDISMKPAWHVVYLVYSRYKNVNTAVSRLTTRAHNGLLTTYQSIYRLCTVLQPDEREGKHPAQIMGLLNISAGSHRPRTGQQLVDRSLNDPPCDHAAPDLCARWHAVPPNSHV